MKKMDLQQLNPRDYDDLIIDPNTILGWFDLCDAAWIHDGDPKKPHAELTSGLCSNGYFDCPRVLKYPNLNEILAKQLVRRLNENGLEKVDWVVGSAYAAITFSYEVARVLGAIHGFVEKDPADPSGKRMTWRRMVIPAGSKVLQIEDLIATSGTLREVRRAIEEGQGQEQVEFFPIIGTLVHRPPKLPADYGEKKVVALIEKEIWAVDPSECPLCKAGSVRYRPKTNWAELTGKG